LEELWRVSSRESVSEKGRHVTSLTIIQAKYATSLQGAKSGGTQESNFIDETVSRGDGGLKFPDQGPG
jgi:hypothetical protein